MTKIETPLFNLRGETRGFCLCALVRLTLTDN